MSFSNFIVPSTLLLFVTTIGCINSFLVPSSPSSIGRGIDYKQCHPSLACRSHTSQSFGLERQQEYKSPFHSSTLLHHYHHHHQHQHNVNIHSTSSSKIYMKRRTYDDLERSEYSSNPKNWTADVFENGTKPLMVFPLTERKLEEVQTEYKNANDDGVMNGWTFHRGQDVIAPSLSLNGRNVNNSEEEEDGTAWVVRSDDNDEDDTKEEEKEESNTMSNILESQLNQLAPASQIAYFYLQDTLGLPEQTMWKLTLDAASVLGFSVPNLEAKVSLLKRTMNLSEEDVRVILGKQPSILHLSADKNLGPTILFLVRTLDLSKDELRSVVLQYPCILCYAISNLFRKVNFFRDTMGYSTEETRELILMEPKLMCASVSTGLEPRLAYLHAEMKIPLNILRVAIEKNPRLLLYSVAQNLRPKVSSFLVATLQMNTKQICRLIQSYPLLMDYNLQNTILPIYSYFTEELGYSPLEFRSILLKHPLLVTHSLYKIKHLVGVLRYELDMDASQVKRVLFQAPQTLNINTDNNLKCTVEFLREEFGLEEGELRKVLVGMPTLLICSVEKNLRPKIEYLRREFCSKYDGGGYNEGLDNDNNGGSVGLQKLKEAVITQPTLLGYSLEKRIKPRLEKIRAAEVDLRKITVGITMTEEKFEKWLAKRKAKVELYGPEVAARLGSRRGKKTTRVVTAFEKSSSSLVPLLEGAKDEDEEKQREAERRKGRIVHWKR